VAAGGAPGGESFQLATVVDGRNAAQVKPGVASELLDAGWKIGGQWLVVSGQSPAIRCRLSAKTTSSPQGYHFTADRVELPTGPRALTIGM